MEQITLIKGIIQYKEHPFFKSSGIYLLSLKRLPNGVPYIAYLLQYNFFTLVESSGKRF
jgi:hypothetical protein